MDDGPSGVPLQDDAEYPPLPDPKPKPAPVVASQPPAKQSDDYGKGADYTGTIPRGYPPPGLLAHVYMGKGYGTKAGFNQHMYGGQDPWITTVRKGGRGGGPPRAADLEHWPYTDHTHTARLE